MTWLFRSLHYFHLNSDPGPTAFSLSSGLASHETFTTIFEAFSNVDFSPSPVHISFSLPNGVNPHDHAVIFPKGTVELSLRLHGGNWLDPSSLPRCIESLPNLKRLEICIHSTWKHCAERDAGPLDPDSGCTHALIKESACIQFIEDRDVKELTLEVLRSCQPCWSFLLGPYYIDIQIFPGFDRFEREVLGWFERSTSLDRIMVRHRGRTTLDYLYGHLRTRTLLALSTTGLMKRMCGGLW